MVSVARAASTSAGSSSPVIGGGWLRCNDPPGSTPDSRHSFASGAQAWEVLAQILVIVCYGEDLLWTVISVRGTKKMADIGLTASRGGGF